MTLFWYKAAIEAKQTEAKPEKSIKYVNTLKSIEKSITTILIRKGKIITLGKIENSAVTLTVEPS